jgi:hypothetical protein
LSAQRIITDMVQTLGLFADPGLDFAS